MKLKKLLINTGVFKIKVKICGITAEKEIGYLNELKPDYAGFLFTKSKRQIDPVKAEKLIKKLSENIKTVGVFKDNSMEEIIKAAEISNVDIIQLHGKESIEFVKELKTYLKKDTEIWKALSISNEELLKTYINFYENDEDKLLGNLLIDGANPGSGETFSLKALENLIGNKKDFKYILAGGITPENAAERAENIKIKPYAVDVSSGAEYIDENGVRGKSYDKIKKIIEAVKL